MLDRFIDLVADTGDTHHPLEKKCCAMSCLGGDSSASREP